MFDLDLQRFRRPEYTGANRCRACTVVNAAILLIAVGVVWQWSPLLAIAIGTVGVAGIVLRGYVVPFTPRFAPAIVAPLPGNLFEHTAPAESDALSEITTDNTDSEAVLRTLVDVGVVITSGDRLGLDEGFESAWRAQMDTLADATDDRLATMARDATPAVAAARVERTGGEAFLVVTGDSGATSWLHRPVALAEVAAAAAFGETDLPAAHRAVAASALCAFLETCPACGDDLVEGRLDDCCGHSLDGADADPPYGLACATCEVVFHRFETAGEG